MDLNYGVLILAAGASTRMGTSKELLQIENESLLRKTINTALAIRPINCTVVLGANYEGHYNEIKDLPVNIINNLQWKEGKGSSIKSGIQNLVKYRVDAVYVLVCDQPCLTSDHLKNLALRYTQTKVPIIASGYTNTIGVPALFDRPMYQTLMQLPNEEGAKKIILKNRKTVVAFDGARLILIQWKISIIISTIPEIKKGFGKYRTPFL